MKIDRLLAIITILLQKEKVTAPELAERLEVSRRTIGRDIEDICKAGIPIVTKQGGDGGIYIAEGYKLDKNILTSDELQNIITGLKSLESVSNTSNIEKLLYKLSPAKDALVSLRDSIVIDLSSYYKTSLSEKISLIKAAIRDNRLVAFDYYSDKGMSRRTVEPYYMVFRWSAWYLFGFCVERDDFRLFKLNRLWQLTLLEQTFLPRDIPTDKQELDTFFTDHEKMIVLFDKKVAYLLIEEYGPNCYTETEDGRLRFEGSYTNRDYIIRWILGFGDQAEVLLPTDLRDQIKNQAEKMLGKYK